MLGSELSMKQHIAKVTTDLFELRWLRHVRRFIRQELTAQLVHAVILSRFNYGNLVVFPIYLPSHPILPLHILLFPFGTGYLFT